MPLYSIKGPDGKVYSIEGPAGATREEVIDAITHRQEEKAAAQTAHLEKTGFFPALKSAGRSALGATEEYLGEKFKSPELKAAAAEQKQKAAETYEPTTAEDIKAAQGILPTASRSISKYITEPVGGIIGRYGVPIVAGAGAVAAAPEELALSPFLISGGATALANMPTAAGENIQRQKEVGAPVNVAKAELYGVAQSILAGFVPFGGKVNKVIGPQLIAEAERLAPAVAEGQITKEAATQALSSKAQSFLRATGANAVTGTGLMVGTEALTRGAAGQDIASADALKAYKEQAEAALAMSPLFGAIHPTNRAGALAKLEEAQQRKNVVDRVNEERAKQDQYIQDLLAQASEDQKAQIRAQINAAPNRPLIDIINEVTGVSQPPAGNTRQNFVQAFNEPSGRRVSDPTTGLERELTTGELHMQQNPDLFTEEAKQTLMLPPGEQKALIVFPDGSVGTEADVQAHVRTLPTNEQSAFLSKLYGYEPQKADVKVEAPKAPGLLPSYAGEPLVAFPDGSLGTRRQAEEYINSLPEEERIAARAQLLGYKAEPTATVINKDTLAELVPTLKPQAGIFKRLEKLGDIDTEAKLTSLHSELDKLGEKHAVNEAKLKEIEDAYKQKVDEGKAAERDLTGTDTEALGAGISTTGKRLGRRGTPRTAGLELGRVADTGESLREPADRTSGVDTALEAPQAQEVLKAEETPVDHTVEAKQVAAELRALDPEHPMIEGLKDELNVTPEEVEAGKQEVQALKAGREESVQRATEELPTVDERAKEPDVDMEAFEAAKDTLNSYLRQNFSGAKNIVPEEKVTHAQAMIALADIMTHIVRQGVKSIGHAIREARKALGERGKYVTDDQLKAAYDTAVARAPKVEEAKPAAKVETKTDSELERLHKEAGGKGPSNEQPTSAFRSFKDDPEHFIAEKKKGLQHFLDHMETQYFSSDAGLNKSIRRGLQASGASWEAIKKMMFEVSTSQALHAEGVAHRFLELGGMKYNPELMKFEAFEDPKGSWKGTIDAIKAAADAKGVSYGEMEQYAHKALEARRLALDVIPFNKRLRAKEDALVAKGDKTQAQADRDFEDNAKTVHMTDAQIAAGMKFFDKVPELKKVADQWDNTRRNVIEFAESTGLYTKEKAEALLDTLAYVPFFRVEQLENRAGPKEFSRGLLDAATDKKFKGSYQDVNNIFDNMERWTSYMIRKGVNNKSAQNLTRAAMKYMPDEVRVVDRVAHGMRENTFSIWENGEKVMYEFKDPMFVHAFTGMESVAIPALEGFAWFTNALRQNIVLNPLFSIGQLSQDAFGAMLSSGLKHPFAIPLEVMKEFSKTLRGFSKSHEELKNLGAVGLRDYSATASRVDAEIAAGLKAPTKFQKFKAPFEKLSMASDNAVRQAIYNRTLLETGGKRMADGRIVGGDKATATERAFEIINFRRGGASQNVALLRRTVPFFGAYLQSMNVAMKVLSGRGISPTEKAEAYRVLASNMAKVLALGFIYNTVISEDEGYKKLDPTVRDRHLVIPGTDGVMIPLRSDVFTLLAKIIPEHMYQMTMAEETEDATKAKKAIGDAMANALLSPNVMPQAIKPLVEVSLNKNLWTGQPIVGQGQENLETELQFGPNTSQLAKVIGSTGLVAPLNVDYLLKSYFGYTGGMLLQGTDTAIAQMTGQVIPDQSGRDMIASIPGMSTFVSKEFGTRDMNDFYELKAETNKAVATMNKLKEIGTPEEVQAYREKNQELITANKRIERIANNLSKLKKRERQIHASEDYTAAEKQELLHDLKVREHQMVSTIDDLRKEAGL